MTDANKVLKRAKPLKQRVTQWLGVLVIIMAVIVFPALMIFIAFDKHDPQWVTCDVIDAKPTKGNRFSDSDWRIDIETQDCGVVLYSVSVNTDNVEELAASFEPGRYDFQLGLPSRLAADGWLPVMSPTARDYRAAP